jgi:hypothetical protein
MGCTLRISVRAGWLAADLCTGVRIAAQVGLVHLYKSSWRFAVFTHFLHALYHQEPSIFPVVTVTRNSCFCTSKHTNKWIGTQDHHTQVYISMQIQMFIVWLLVDNRIHLSWFIVWLWASNTTTCYLNLCVTEFLVALESACLYKFR